MGKLAYTASFFFAPRASQLRSLNIEKGQTPPLRGRGSSSFFNKEKTTRNSLIYYHFVDLLQLRR